jgi:ABC-type transport system involved in multi-copper enzyme maturation permease subunit
MMENKSQIFAQDLERWTGARAPHTPAWLLIARASLINLLSSVGCLNRFALWSSFIIYYFFIVMSTFVRHQWGNLAKVESLRGIFEVFQGQNLEVSEQTFQNSFIVVPTLVFGTLSMLTYGSRLICKDRAANALQVYFSKAVSRWDYVLGKTAAVAAIIALTTIIPAAMMSLLGLFLAPDFWDQVIDSWSTPIQAVIFWLLATASFAAVSLAVSSLTEKPYIAGVGFVGFLLFLMMGTGILEGILGSKAYFLGINPHVALFTLGSSIYDSANADWGRAVVYLIAQALLCGLMYLIVFRRIRPVEVVK